MQPRNPAVLQVEQQHGAQFRQGRQRRESGRPHGDRIARTGDALVVKDVAPTADGLIEYHHGRETPSRSGRRGSVRDVGLVDVGVLVGGIRLRLSQRAGVKLDQ